MRRALAVYAAMTLTGATLWMWAVRTAGVEGLPLIALVAGEAFALAAARPLGYAVRRAKKPPTRRVETGKGVET